MINVIVAFVLGVALGGLGAYVYINIFGIKKAK